MMRSVTSDAPILIIGAGIAGLALAQGLRLSSIPFRVFERSPYSHQSQGHRFRISQEGQASLASVLAPKLQTLLHQTVAESHRFEPRYIDARKLDFGEPTLVDPKTTTPTMPIDRTWIRMLMMSDIVEAIEFEKEFLSYEVVDGYVRVRFTDGSLAHGVLLVGADGSKSQVRKQLQPNRRLLDLERWTIWGRTPLTEPLKERLPQDVLSWCMYLDHEANVQAVVEPMTWAKSVQSVSRGRLPDFTDYIYWVICTASLPHLDLPKTAEEKRRFLEQVTQSWHPALKLLFESATYDRLACAPVLSSKPNIEIRTTTEWAGSVTIIGDAAHAMSPMGGSGGDTAIRDAADLAQTISKVGVTSECLAGFEMRMEERAKERIEHSFNGGKKFWRGKDWTEYNEIDM